MDLLIIDNLGKDSPSVEHLDGDDCFQAIDQQQAQLLTSILPADIPLPSSVRDENRNAYIDHRHTMHVTH
jgi:hypothetical protein